MKETLTFNEYGKFKMIQFTDIHWVDGCALDIKTLNLIKNIIKSEDPDFIVITGDLIYGERNLEHLRIALSPIIEANVPWAFVFGNHDTEIGHSREELYNELITLPGCLMERGAPDVKGVGNYYLTLKNKENSVEWVFYFLDSGDYNQNPLVKGYDFIDTSQINWYKKTFTMLQNTYGDYGGLCFFHIPLPEYNEVWDTCICKGRKLEDICCPKQNSGMFSAMLEQNDINGVFVGHDHINDFEGTLYGISLCFGRVTGYNTYGKKGYQHGARIIVLDEYDRNHFTSYIRLDDGSVILKPKIHKPKLRLI